MISFPDCVFTVELLSIKSDIRRASVGWQTHLLTQKGFPQTSSVVDPHNTEIRGARLSYRET